MMIQEKGCSKKAWNSFVSKTRSVSPISSEKLTKYIKIKKSLFPTDSVIIDYYESIFSKITCAANRTKWHLMDKLLLVWCIAKVLKFRGKRQLIPEQQDFEYVAEILNVNKKLLELKWLSLLHSNLQIKQWTPEEDEQLILICNEILSSNNWTEITMKFNSLSKTQRYPKQIRERYNNVLSPNLYKTKWTQEESKLLIELVKQYGKKWSKLSVHFQGKSENQLKVKFKDLNKSVKQQKKCKNKNKNLDSVNVLQNPQQISQQLDAQKKQIQQTSLLEQPKQFELVQGEQQNDSRQAQPIYHNYSPQIIYPQYVQGQQYFQQYQNCYQRLNSYNYPNYITYNSANFQFLNYYQY